MKNRFTSIFLIIFLVDSVLTVIQSLLYLSGINLFDAVAVKTLRALLSFSMLPLSIIQVIVYFKHKLKFSAFVLGFYPIVVVLISMLVGTYIFIVKKVVFNTSEYLHTIHLIMLIGGTIQLLIGIWAWKDLSKGHVRSITS